MAPKTCRVLRLSVFDERHRTQKSNLTFFKKNHKNLVKPAFYSAARYAGSLFSGGVYFRGSLFFAGVCFQEFQRIDTRHRSLARSKCP